MIIYDNLCASAGDAIPSFLALTASSIISFYIAKKIFHPNTPSQELLNSNSIQDTFDSIIGNDEAKENFQEIISFLKNPNIFKTIGLKTPKGILLHGKPGNGKTMLARAVAKESNCSFIAVSGPELEDKYLGQSAANIKALFQKARKNQPCIIFIDEIDSIGRKRDGRQYPDALLQLLAEMDGFSQSDNIIVIGATNNPESLDPALLRAGRFDRKIEVKDPDLQSRILLLKTLFSKIKFIISITDEEFNEWGLKTEGFCNADIAHIANEAGLKALQNKQNDTGKKLTISITYNDLMNITNKEIESKQKINNPTVNTFDLSSTLNQII